MFAFYCPDSLPSFEASFFPTENRAHPHFTINALVTMRELVEDGSPPLPEPGVVRNGDCVDINLEVELIDEETARQAIANHLGVPAEQISFV